MCRRIWIITNRALPCSLPPAWRALATNVVCICDCADHLFGMSSVEAKYIHTPQSNRSCQKFTEKASAETPNGKCFSLPFLHLKEKELNFFKWKIVVVIWRFSCDVEPVRCSSVRSQYAFYSLRPSDPYARYEAKAVRRNSLSNGKCLQFPLLSGVHDLHCPRPRRRPVSSTPFVFNDFVQLSKWDGTCGQLMLTAIEDIGNTILCCFARVLTTPRWIIAKMLWAYASLFSSETQSLREATREREKDTKNRIIAYESLELLYLASVNFVNRFFGRVRPSSSSSSRSHRIESIRILSEREQLASDLHSVWTSE